MTPLDRVARRVAGSLATALGALLVGGGAVQAQVMDDHIYTYLAFDELELVADGEERPVEIDGEAWVGGDYHRLWFKADAEAPTRGDGFELKAQALYSRTVSAWWNLQAGLGLDHHDGGDGGRTRGLVALGVEGLAPYWFEMEAFLFVSHEGHVSASFETSYDLLLTQRLVLEPELEVGAALQSVEAFGVGSGLNDVELSGRLRYEILRELAPYVGVSWLRRFGETRDLAHLEGRGGDTSVVAGLRWWY